MSTESNQAIDMMIPSGEWVTISLFHSGYVEGDAFDWIDRNGPKLGDTKPLQLPCGAYVRLETALAIRARDS